MHFFIKWNKETDKISNEVDKICSDIWFFSELERNSFENKTPKDGIVDRLQIVKYLVNTG